MMNTNFHQSKHDKSDLSQDRRYSRCLFDIYLTGFIFPKHTGLLPPIFKNKYSDQLQLPGDPSRVPSFYITAGLFLYRIKSGIPPSLYSNNLIMKSKTVK